MRSNVERKRISPKSAQQVSGTSWMVTFSDLLTLLLTMFVMRLSMSTLDNTSIVEKLSTKVRYSEQATPGEKPGGFHSTRPEVDAHHKHSVETALQSFVAKELSKTLGTPTSAPTEKTLEFASEFKVKPWKDGSVISLGGSTFLSGSVEITFEAETAVRSLAKSLQEKEVEIRIAGHTDNIPVNSTQFPSNWELSAARAITIARQMIDAGVDEQTIAAVGYADSKPIANNQTDEGRHLNRRVEIYIVPKKNEE